MLSLPDVTMVIEEISGSSVSPTQRLSILKTPPAEEPRHARKDAELIFHKHRNYMSQLSPLHKQHVAQAGAGGNDG